MNTQEEMLQDELLQDELNQDELLHYQSCQDELRDLEQERLERYLNGEYDYQEDDSDDEDPLPKWNIPNWKGNAKEQEQKENKCLYCVTRFTSENERRGCADCDEYWDMPDLIYSKTDADKDCVGCELLDSGEGGVE